MTANLPIIFFNWNCVFRRHAVRSVSRQILVWLDVQSCFFCHALSCCDCSSTWAHLLARLLLRLIVLRLCSTCWCLEEGIRGFFSFLFFFLDCHTFTNPHLSIFVPIQFLTHFPRMASSSSLPHTSIPPPPSPVLWPFNTPLKSQEEEHNQYVTIYASSGSLCNASQRIVQSDELICQALSPWNATCINIEAEC